MHILCIAKVGAHDEFGTAAAKQCTNRPDRMFRSTNAPLWIELRVVGPDGEIGRRNGLENLSGSRGNGLLDPIKFGEPPRLNGASGNAEPIHAMKRWQV